MREWRVLQEIVHREQDKIAHLLPHPIMLAFAVEEMRSRSSLRSASIDSGKRPSRAEASARASRSEPNTWIGRRI